MNQPQTTQATLQANPSPFQANPSPFQTTQTPFHTTPNPFQATKSPFQTTTLPIQATQTTSQTPPQTTLKAPILPALPVIPPISTRPITLIVIHCTATRNTSDLTPAALQREHLRRFSGGCGYHYYIRKNGTIHPMRPLNTPGAHARGYNAHSIGIAYEGGLNAQGIPSDTRTPQQRAALRSLLSTLRQTYPGARILGHRDLSPDLNHNGTIEPAEYIKQCPCFNAIPEYSDL